MQTEPTIQELVSSLLLAKRDEEHARSARVDLEQQLAARLEAPEEGRKTHRIGPYSVTVQNKLIRSVNWIEWGKIEESIPLTLRPFRVKTELDLKGLKWLERNLPDIAARVSECLTTKPAKTAVTVKKETENGS